ncbi:GumC family protein [Hyphomicrobium sulfonivorans]|uniref:GumC family protein n=1 Tax=Hyphomicrobium sulfonivorans TaxID=121290 RepID=UPI00156F5889|nr:polysaccharide biosynthesis tyrosine autokinase [Hyphomicrobium sulfonivorans]MBI1649592.1 polysaccharide biosynthesis tyrosine autokinase [Hyphomicrobium sulfonivorans]NSL71507.1 capsular biosynthesis protein [Hyphomicrobium sulfonivorans]
MTHNENVPAGDDRRPSNIAPIQQTQRPAFVGYADAGYPNYSDAAILQAEPATNLREYWRIANKRKWLILGVTGAFFVMGVIISLMMTPLYTATVRLQIDRNVAKVVDGGNVTPLEGTDIEFLKTQYELLQSRGLAERVVVALKLGDSEAFQGSRGPSLLGSLLGMLSSSGDTPTKGNQRAERERRSIDLVLQSRSVRPIAGSRLVDVSFTDPDPVMAQRIATALASAYSDSNLDKRFQANVYAKTFLEDQVKQLKLRLEESEKQLLDFAQKEQIVAVSEKASIAENNLASANAALGVLVSERIKSEQLWRQVENASQINMPQLLSNKVIEGLRDQRNLLATEYQEKLETFKPGYPAMVQIQNKVDEIDRQLSVEIQTIKDSLKAGFASAAAQEEEMKKQIEQLRVEALDLQKRSIRYNILKREVDTNRGLYEGLLQRHKEVDVAGGVGANNIFIVDRAEVPIAPSSPKLVRSILLSLLLGLGVGVGAAVLQEMMDDSVRNIDDLERVTGLPSLGVIPKVSREPVEAEFADPRSPVMEAYRSLCTSLQLTTASGLPKSLAVTSAGPAEGKSITAMAIARHFANMGLKVLLVDGDMRNPSLHKKMAIPNGAGLSSYLAGACAPPDTFQATDIATLAFMSSGPLPPSAADLLAGPRLHSLLRVGLEVFDLIVIDAPPVMGMADASILANTVEATVFVVGAGQSTSGQIGAVLKRLRLGHPSLIGAVLTKFDAVAEGYGYGYGYDYNYGVDQKLSAGDHSVPRLGG